MVRSNDHSFEGLLKGATSDITALQRRFLSVIPPRLSTTGEETADWDDAVENGKYWGTGAANAPVAGDVMADVLVNAAGWIVQTAPDPANPARVYRRSRVAGAWSAWVRSSVPGEDGQPFRMAAGIIASPGGGSSSAPIFWDAGTTVTLPVGRFTVAPIITVTTRNSSGMVLLGPMVASTPTTASFVIRMYRVGSAPDANVIAMWHAIQMTSGSAAG